MYICVLIQVLAVDVVQNSEGWFTSSQLRVGSAITFKLVLYVCMHVLHVHIHILYCNMHFLN